MEKKINQTDIKNFYQSLGRPLDDFLFLRRRQQDVLFDKKWQKFLKRSWLFQYLPFIRFVFSAGSMTLGSVNKFSDFDALVGVKSGRIFISRFFTVLFFGFFGWRRRKIDHQESASDKVCFSHFFTENILEPGYPYDVYRHQLYSNLVPIFGQPAEINNFLISMEKISETPEFREDLRHQWRQNSLIKKILEKILSGRLGDLMEKVLKTFQIKRIKKSFKKVSLGAAPRIKYNDDELEFHPHNNS